MTTAPASAVDLHLEALRDRAVSEHRATQASGRDLRQTQELLRHRSVSSTQIYSWVDPLPVMVATPTEHDGKEDAAPHT